MTVTRDIYFQMIEAGAFADVNVELLDSNICAVPRQTNAHAWLIDAAKKALESKLGPDYWVRFHAPIDLSDVSVPNPDVAVVPANAASWWGKETPTTALLVVEVNDSNIEYDRNLKGRLYAAAGIAEYWVVNVNHKKLEVYRDPKPDADEELGNRYMKLTTLDYGQTTDVLGVPGITINVSDLLPPLTP